MRLLLSALGCALGVSALQRQRFGAVDSEALVPRYLVDQAFPLARRAGECGEGQHSCEDIGYGDQCCENSRYCFINNDGDPKCCQIGLNCLNQGPCSSDRFFCTTTPSATGTASAAAETGCCPRSCPGTSEYLCPSSLGGGCCDYDSDCRAGGNCAFRVTSTTASDTASLTPAAEGCTTSQYRCDDGVGCCNNDYRCTLVDGEAYCAPGRPTGDIEPADDDGGDDLSDGAKVGIGVGSVVGAGIIIGALTWLCLRKRRDRRQTIQPSELSNVQYDRQDQTAMTDITAASSRRQQGTAPTRDYFGPNAVAGPYTTDAVERSPGSSPGPDRAVPSRPQQPGDIAHAVEMDSNASPDDGRMSPASASQPNYFTAAVPIHAVEGTFELYSPQSEHAPPFSPIAPSSPGESEPRRDGKP